MQKTLPTIDPTEIIPVAVARPIFAVPPHKDGRGLYVWIDPFNGELHIVAEELTLSPAPAKSFVDGRTVVLVRGQAIFVGPQLLGEFRQTGEWKDLPDKLWDVIERLTLYEMEALGRRDRWLRSPPVILGESAVVC
jgi:hypothetical protein